MQYETDYKKISLDFLIEKIGLFFLYITKEDLMRMKKKYGFPRIINNWKIPVTKREYDIIKNSQKNGRSHDVTLFIQKNGKYACIQKPNYPDKEIFRAPSGGVRVGESMEDGALREAKEETGLYIELTRFLLQIESEFVLEAENKSIPWTSYIFLAKAKSGKMEPIDKREISNVKLISEADLKGKIFKKMMDSKSAGLGYRAMLTLETFKEIDMEG